MSQNSLHIDCRAECFCLRELSLVLGELRLMVTMIYSDIAVNVLYV